MSGNYVGLVKMRFVGKPDGVLMRGAPGSPYEHGKIYSVPAKFSQWKFWEVVENPPEIKAPEAGKEDSVFKDEVFIPPMEVTSSVAPTPILSSSLQVGDVTQSTPETKLDMLPIVVQEGLEDNKAYVIAPPTSPMEPPQIIPIVNLEKVTTPTELVVTQETHDDKPAEVKENAVMETPKENVIIADFTGLGEDNPDDEDLDALPPDLAAEMRSLGEELPGEQVIQKRRGRKPKVN